MCKNYFSARIFLSLAHLTYVAFCKEREKYGRPSRSPIAMTVLQIYTCHFLCYMSIILHCWYVSVLITLTDFLFLLWCISWCFMLCFSWIFYLIIVITGCVIFFSLVFSQPLNLSLIKHQWINIFKFIQNRLIFARFVCRCRYTTIASCVVTRYTR